MKQTFKIFLCSILAIGGMVSCSKDELDSESIFSIKPEVIDKTRYSAPLDSFCKKNFLETYNVNFKYKMDDMASDVNKNLTPASYENCEKMAVLVKYLWYDVYHYNVGKNDSAGYEFLKKNSPRIIHLIGSRNMNPVQGTEILGTAEGGIKTTLYRANELDITDLDYCNTYYFHVMHHEFGHQLCSRFVVPRDYRTISSGFYDALGWQNTCDSVALGDGFITQYSRNNYEDDFVEMLSTYATSTPAFWEDRLERAKFQWEEVTFDKDTHGWKEFDRMQSKIIREGGNRDSVGYLKEQTSNNKTIVRKVIKRTVSENKNDYTYAIPDAEGNIQYVLKEAGTTGTDKLNKKLDLLKVWLKDNYEIELDTIRQAVLERSYETNPDGSLILDEKGKPINRIVQPYKGSATLLDYLLENMRNYKTIDEFDFLKK
ncbi:MAG: hypothetical protein HUK03_03830 [Bacteroidaceae bacterium]|nr:hypothetical protein [Bacteroidaceae bacterium]